MVDKEVVMVEGALDLKETRVMIIVEVEEEAGVLIHSQMLKMKEKKIPEDGEMTMLVVVEAIIGAVMIKTWLLLNQIDLEVVEEAEEVREEDQ